MILFTRDIQCFLNIDEYRSCPCCHSSGDFDMRRLHHNKWIMDVFQCNLCNAEIEHLIRCDGSWCIWLNGVPQAIYQDGVYQRLEDANIHYNEMVDNIQSNVKTSSYKKYRVTTPNGEVHEVSNLSQFARDIGVKISTLRMQSKGWQVQVLSDWVRTKKNVPKKKKRTYIIKKPNGEIVETNNLTKFSRENGVWSSTIQQNCKGWVLLEDTGYITKRKSSYKKKYNRRRKFKLTDPNGKIFYTYKLDKFAIEHGIKPSTLYNANDKTKWKKEVFWEDVYE